LIVFLVFLVLLFSIFLLFCDLQSPLVGNSILQLV
jgi:hypothetical protein